jgi:hypothetical protein
MIEVAIGVLLLVRQVRRWAALISLGLLGIYVLAVYHILVSTVPVFDNVFLNTAFRTALMPNNIFLAICSVYLLQHPDASLAATPESRGDAASQPPAITGGATLLVAALLLMANCAGFLAIAIGMRAHFPTACLWAMMCIATGALIGFLFAVPRVNPEAKSASFFITNTNIEQVSDWVTKILVGVALINFKEIGGFLDSLSGGLATSLAGQDALPDKPTALSLIVYFFVVGLIQGYLLTLLFLFRQFQLLTQASGTKPQASGLASSAAAAAKPPGAPAVG